MKRVKTPTALGLISYFNATSKGLICHANIDKNQYSSVTSANTKQNLDQQRKVEKKEKGNKKREREVIKDKETTPKQAIYKLVYIKHLLYPTWYFKASWQ